MVQIITDTTACLPEEIARRYNIPVIPQVIVFGEKAFYEGVDMDINEFMRRLRSSKDMPKTAAPPPELFSEQFQRLALSGESILCIHPSSEVSGTVSSAIVAAKDFPNTDIRVIDTRMVASPLGTMVQLAAEWAIAGEDADTIEARVHDLMGRVRIYFLVATLEYLARGGRIGGASALLGSVLQIKPILRLYDGRVEPYERERTQRRALARLKEIVNEQAPHDGSAYLTVMHADCAEEGNSLAEELGKMVNQAVVPVVNMPPAIVTHGGPGILAAGFFVKAGN
jgi:DegV family protein with EDD domain